MELANALLVGHRKGRIELSAIHTFLDLIHDLSIETDPAGDDTITRQVMATAPHYDLTAYNAAYLALAQRRGLPLATHDRAQQRAAARSGVTLIPV
jgi:predicted nucleic acid-binding protein